MHLENICKANFSNGYNQGIIGTITILQKQFESRITLPENNIRKYYCFSVNFQFQQVKTYSCKIFLTPIIQMVIIEELLGRF